MLVVEDEIEKIIGALGVAPLALRFLLSRPFFRFGPCLLREAPEGFVAAIELPIGDFFGGPNGGKSTTAERCEWSSASGHLCPSSFSK